MLLIPTITETWFDLHTRNVIKSTSSGYYAIINNKQTHENENSKHEITILIRNRTEINYFGIANRKN